MILALMLASLAAQATLKFDGPAGWKPVPVTSAMRVAEFALPKAPGDGEDASLVLYFFGGTGGSVQANLDRWVGQIVQPDGKSSAALATTTKLSGRGVSVTLLDVGGTYVAELTPGSTERHNKPGYRLRAAVVETTNGPYYIKLVGPSATVARWDAGFLAFLKSLRVE